MQKAKHFNTFMTFYKCCAGKLFLKIQILNSTKLIEFADDNFKLDENGGKFSKQMENTGKRRNCSS